MSEIAEQSPPPAEVIPPPAIQRVGPADINEMGPWLLPRIVEHWKTNDQLAMYWLRGALPSNEQALVRCGDAIGMAHIEPGRLGQPPRVVVDFVLCQRGEAGVDVMKEIYGWFVQWARSMSASGVFRLDGCSDLHRTWIRDKIGRLTKTESVNLVF
jgi:hypothetical protein